MEPERLDPVSGNLEKILERIVRLRAAIRYHRAQVGDYRCWVDDARLYRAASGADGLPEVPRPEEFMRRCEAFWDRRQRPEEKGRGDPAINSALSRLEIPPFSDADLSALGADEAAALLQRFLSAVSDHEAKGFEGRTAQDDESLYALLPEQISWNSALPQREAFLANCARFCGHCQKHPHSILEWSE